MDIQGKVALITGASSGIGLATAELMAQRGARVVASDIKEEQGQKTVEAIQKQGGDIRFKAADVGNEEDVKELVECTVTTFSTLDILVNSAGIWLPKKDLPTHQMSEETWDAMLRVNLRGTFLPCKYSLPIMMKQGGGSIINLSSVVGLVGAAGFSHAYATTKGGIITFTKSLAVTYGEYNIRANALCPGEIETPMTGDMHKDEEYCQELLREIPLRRFGKAEEIAKLALFLASDDSSYITGAAIPIDGGFLA